jgi:hypothetical protein
VRCPPCSRPQQLTIPRNSRQQDQTIDPSSAFLLRVCEFDLGVGLAREATARASTSKVSPASLAAGRSKWKDHGGLTPGHHPVSY